MQLHSGCYQEKYASHFSTSGTLTLMVTLPLLTFLMLKPTVGIMSSLNCPLYIKEHTKMHLLAQRGIPSGGHYIESHCTHSTTTYSNDVHKSGLSRVLETYQSQFHLFLPKETAEPLNNPVHKAQHLEWFRWQGGSRSYGCYQSRVRGARSATSVLQLR